MNNQSGNVLFLILIAVALFAALSYAVTQSTQSGGGTSSNETSLINVSALMQYPVGVRTAVVRMVIGGTDVADLEFNDPSNFGDCTSPQVCVFHPEGGGATYANAPKNFMVPNGPNPEGQWVFTSHTEVINIGQSVPGSFEGNDIVAFLWGVTETLCKRINKEVGISSDPTSFHPNLPSASTSQTGSDLSFNNMDHSYSTGAEILVLGSGPDLSALDGQHQGCLFDEDWAEGSVNGAFTYYQVLLER